MLVNIDFPIPKELSDRVIREETLALMNGRWAIGGSQTINSFRKRSMCPKGYCSSSGKRGALYTLIASAGTDWCDCRLLHVYHSSKLKEVEKAPVQEKKHTPVSSPEGEMPTLMFIVNEIVYAYDKGKSGGVLYEARVIELKEDAAGCLKYLMKYKGYKKSHNRWLSAEEMMKQTKRNHVTYLKSRSQSSLTSMPSAKTTRIQTLATKSKAKHLQPSLASKSSKRTKRRSSGSGSTSERVESKRKRQSSPLRLSSLRFEVHEKVFAYDKGKSGDSVLYDATVIKLKEDAGRYLVKYKGYKKSHDKWLSAEEMMKQTKHNRVRFENSRM